MPKLRGDENLTARDIRLSDCLSNGLLIVVSRSLDNMLSVNLTKNERAGKGMYGIKMAVATL